jgi:hypothetical protein
MHSTSFHDKSSDETRNGRNVPEHNKGIYDKPIANIILNGKKTEAISVKVRNETSCSYSI